MAAFCSRSRARAACFFLAAFLEGHPPTNRIEPNKPPARSPGLISHRYFFFFFFHLGRVDPGPWRPRDAMSQSLGEIFGELGISQYLDAFVDQGFDTWDTILDITESDL